MLIYNYDKNGYYTSSQQAKKDPLESAKGSDVYLIPANATTKQALAPKEGKLIKFIGGDWTYEDIIEEPKVEKTEEKILEQAKLLRLGARKTYLASTDWYITREVDTPDSYPIAIKTKRIQARTEINAIENLTTLVEVEVYNETFE